MILYFRSESYFMKALSIFSFSILFFVTACKKEKKEYHVGGLKDIEMVQGYDTLYLSIEIDKNAEDAALSIINLPSNITALIIPQDSTGRKYNIRFVTHYLSAGYVEENVIPGKILDTGVYNVGLVLSTPASVNQFPFTIHITPHYILRKAGVYLQNSSCFLGTVENHPVNVVVQNRYDDSAWLIGFQDLMTGMGTDLTDTLEICRFYNNNFIPQLVFGNSGYSYPFKGNYSDEKFELSIFYSPTGEGEGGCLIHLTRP